MLFPLKGVHKATWRSPDSRTVNWIDHVLIEQQHLTNILDVLSFRGANVDTDHYLIIVGLRGRMAGMRDEGQ